MFENRVLRKISIPKERESDKRVEKIWYRIL
jgi:hypothetical protein